jgi:hypothetical protein
VDGDDEADGRLAYEMSRPRFLDEVDRRPVRRTCDEPLP